MKVLLKLWLNNGGNMTDPNKPTHGGKGSKPRPVDRKKFDENWDKIFRKKEKDESNFTRPHS